MITGYNTDIEHDGRVFHVQTEDKGIDNPAIESLVYMGGRIIASRQHEYGWLLREGYAEEIVQDLLDQQHRKMLRDIRGGKYDPQGPPAFGAGIITDRGFEEVALDFIEDLVSREQVVLGVAREPAPTAGDPIVLDLNVVGSVRGKPIAQVDIVVRAVPEGEKRSITLFQGRTDDAGKVRAGVDLARDLAGGTLIIVASCPQGKDEQEWIINPA